MNPDRAKRSRYFLEIKNAITPITGAPKTKMALKPAVAIAGLFAIFQLAIVDQASVAIAADSTAHALPVKNPLKNEGSWSDIKDDIVDGKVLQDGSKLLGMEAPFRAEDAATVPIRIVRTPQTADNEKPVTKAMIIIDENPSPVAGTFTFGDAMQPLDFETRIRVNQYSNVRVVAEIDGQDYMTGRFVKASGGCSAPAGKSPELALANMGKMRLKMFDAKDGAIKQSQPRRNAQLMIRHPNYSGLQRDQITQLFISAHFIDHLEVHQGDDLLFSMEGGISISENPIFRFSYSDNGAQFLSVTATDTEGNKFETKLDKTAVN